MKLEVIKEVELETKRFLKKLNECKSRMNLDKMQEYSYSGNKQSGALKRASLDLSNELIKLRK